MFFSPVFASSISTDKSSYDFGDTIQVSGIVSPVQDGQSIILQIVSPDESDIFTADQFLPSSDGSFSKSYPAKGPKWIIDGTFTIKIFYENWSETTFQFQTESPSELPPESEIQDELKENPESLDDYKDDKINNPNLTTQNPKTIIEGFPNLDKSPDHYFKRYEKEPAYREWFDSQFPGLSIQQVVGYESTHISNFPSPSTSPQSYIDRYHQESTYREWFDSQFPKNSIYEILGFPDPVGIPDWIRDNANWWANGEINNSDFIFGITYLIEKNIITISQHSESNDSKESIPEWVRNNAGWWAYDRISDDEFVNGLEFLVEKGIIRIN